MAEPKLWMRAATGTTWYVTINGKQKPLGNDEVKARKAYHALLAKNYVPPDDSVYRLLNRYLAWCKIHLAPGTFTYRRNRLRRFVKHLGKTRKVSDLKPYHVQRFVDANFVAFSSGARPQESRKIEARHFDREKRCVVFPIKESKGEQRSGIIYLDDMAFEVIDRLSKQWTEGPILRNSRGNPWKKNAIKDRFARLKVKLKEDGLEIPGLCATALRHSYAHHKLFTGTDSLVVSKLMGHADGRMVATRYGHLEEATALLQQVASSNNPLRPAESGGDTPASQSA